MNIPVKQDQTLVGICKSFGITETVSMTLNFNIGKKGLQFGGDLICVLDEAELKRDIRRPMVEQTIGLFNLTMGRSRFNNVVTWFC